jgi:hypothetical protein
VTRRRRPLAAAALGLASLVGVAAAQEPPPAPLPPGNPCADVNLLCPDLVMRPPSDIQVDRREIRGRILLRSRNSIDSRGLGPAELRGRRDGLKTMDARQVIHRTDGSKVYVTTGARLYFQPIPDQGRYWKFANAARFELWALDAAGNRTRLVRVGPKQNYCLRDLDHTRRSPRREVYPACDESRRTRAVTLGTSVGWSDVYGAGYYENWIDVTGVPRGRYAYVHIADPRNGIHELDETNNESQTIVSLPYRRSSAPDYRAYRTWPGE